ncbi:MAG: leucine-rich repeat domain-containing protein [Clostridia bacterium]|nr:leucine-rich repeat domain-containing protein [Clostridia bacterium]
MKKQLLFVFVVMLLCCSLMAQALEISPVEETENGLVTADGDVYQVPKDIEGWLIPGMTCYPVRCGHFAVDLPMEWECFDAGYAYPAIVAMTPDGGVLMVAEYPAEMDPETTEDEYAASFLTEGRALFAGETTESSKLLDTFLLDGLPALQVEMVGQGFEMVWVNDQGDLYFLMYQTGINQLDANVPLVMSSFHLPVQRTPPSAEESFFETQALPDGTLAITAYTGSATHVQVPKTIGGQAVTQLASYAFYETSVRQVLLPDSITSIGEFAFSGCSRLVSIRLPAQLEELPNGMFESCFELYDVQLPDSITRIGESCFYGCSYLESIRLPRNLEQIGNYNFIICQWLERFEVDEDCVGFITQDDGTVLLSKDGKRLVCYAPWQERSQYQVPDGVEVVDAMAFNDANALETVMFPQSIRQIGGGAFARCVRLQRVEIPVMEAELGIMPGMMVQTETGVEKVDAYTSIITGGQTVLVGPEGGAAQQHAQKYDISFEAMEPITD